MFCYYVLEAAEVLQASAGTNNIAVITVDGDELTIGRFRLYFMSLTEVGSSSAPSLSLPRL